MMSVSLRWSFLSLSLLGCAVATEGGPDIVGSGGVPGAGGVGSGGVPAVGVGGVPAGSTGGVVGAGGVVAGTGGIVAGTGGVVAGTGGAAATAVAFTRDGDARFVGVPATAAGYGFAYITGATQTDLPAPLDGATQICGSGSVPVSPDFSYVAGIGWNVNQAGGTGTPEGIYPANVSSLTVTYTNTGGSPLRVQASNGTTHWCHTLPPGSGTITLTPAQFNTACWSGAGSAWNGTGLQSVQLIVPSNADAATTFNACLSGVRIN